MTEIIKDLRIYNDHLMKKLKMDPRDASYQSKIIMLITGFIYERTGMTVLIRYHSNKYTIYDLDTYKSFGSVSDGGHDGVNGYLLRSSWGQLSEVIERIFLKHKLKVCLTDVDKCYNSLPK